MTTSETPALPEHHHIWCNGNPRSPVKGCRWCDPKGDGKEGFWAKYPYNPTDPDGPDKIQQQHFPNVIKREGT